MLVTGGSRGIGAATARLAGARGHAVALTYRSRAEAAQAVVDDITVAGGVALAFQLDVSDEAEVPRVFDAVQAALGPLRVLVNNAGTLEHQMRVEAMDAARWRRVFDTNVVGSFLCAREAVLRMSTLRGGAGGAIVNVSSAAARIGSPGEYVDYAASKAAIDTFTLGLAKEGGGRGHPGERGATGPDPHRHPCQRRRAGARGAREGQRADAAWRATGGSG